MVVMVAPLALGACVAENSGMKTAGLAGKTAPKATQSNGPDAYGYAPVRLAALADGDRVAMPSDKPDWEKLRTAPVQPTPATATAAAKPAKPQPLFGRKPTPAAAPQAPMDEVAALKADVAERKAVLVMMTEGKGDRPSAAAAGQQVAAAAATPAPASAPLAVATADAKPAEAGKSVVATAKEMIDPRNAVPAAISAVAHSADAVRVAAVDTTAAAVNGTKQAINSVQSRIGDTFMASDTITGSAAIDQMIEASAAENNIPSELAYAVVRVESHYKPDVVGGGAYGLSQIKPATARSLGFEGPAKGLFDPQTNLRYGMKYLAGAWEKSGHDVCGTAMRYKGGHRTTTMTRAAADYCSSVKRHMAAIERRRAPANRETLVAAAEREKHIGEAGGRRILGLDSRARVLAANVTTSGAIRPATSPVIFAAASEAGRAVASSGTPVVVGSPAAAVVASNASPVKSGRIVRVYADGAAAVAPTAAVSRLGYAD